MSQAFLGRVAIHLPGYNPGILGSKNSEGTQLCLEPKLRIYGTVMVMECIGLILSTSMDYSLSPFTEHLLINYTY
ncbi:unnamed protein product [Rhizophagus irregularis]|nr:unnamed protein product [Rhizophagus irregularis]